MKFNINFLIVFAYFLISNKTCSEGFHWNKVVRYFNTLCIASEDCEGSTNETDKWRGLMRNPCCQGCDCCENRLTINVTEKYKNDGVTKCLSSIQDDRISDTAIYRFVVKEPMGGCISSTDLHTKLLPSCRDDTLAAPWGNFYPVYSFDKMTNFKNKQCALCHGSERTIEWITFVMLIGGDSSDLYALKNFYKNFNSTDVTLGFSTPTAESAYENNKCYTFQNECSLGLQDTFYIPSSINLTRTDIVQACLEGPASPYIRTQNVRFKNIFCAICNGFVNEEKDNVKCEISDFRDLTGKPMASLLDHRYIESMIEGNNQPYKKVLACLSQNNSPQKTCREVFCPGLQIRLQNGSCGFPMTVIHVDRLFLTLNLTTSEAVDEESLSIMSTTELESLFKSSSPWLEYWQIIEILLRTDTLFHKNRSEFMITAGFKRFDFVNIGFLKSDTENALSRNWNITLGRNIRFNQRFHAHGIFQIINPSSDGVEFKKPKWALNNMDVPLLVNLTSPTWRVLLSKTASFFGGLQSVSMEITSLFFCEHIEVYADEYKGFSGEFPVYLKRQKKYMYPSQFRMFEREDGRKVVVICLEDSDFERVTFDINRSSLVRVVDDCVILVVAIGFMNRFLS